MTVPLSFKCTVKSFLKLWCQFPQKLQQCFNQKQPPEVFYKVVLNTHRKAPILESLSNKVAGLKAFNFIKKRPQHKCFLVYIAKFLSTPILKNICNQLLLHNVWEWL